MSQPLQIVICGLSITSSWGNGHATTYRALIREMKAQGHEVLFLERDTYWYADNRDLPKPAYCRVKLYKTLDEMKSRFTREIRQADVVIVGSYVPEGVAVGEWVTGVAQGVTAFYDIDTPVTLGKLARGDEEYISASLIPRYDLYLSFTGGPTLRVLEQRYGSPRARVLYCSVDPAVYYPEERKSKWDLGYLGTYGADRQPALASLMLQPARAWPAGRFVVAGPLYPKRIRWPANVQRVDHLAPSGHRKFYNSQKFALNVTRADMVRAGYSPSVRLFEAAACGTPIVSDAWPGLSDLFRIGKEILVAKTPEESLRYLREMDEDQRLRMADQARKRVLAKHTAAHRAAELVRLLRQLLENRSAKRRVVVSRNGPLSVASI